MACACVFILCLASTRVSAQQLEPRAFAPNPVDARFAIATWAHTEGEVFLSQSIPIEDFRIVADSLLAGFGGTFALGSRLASLAVIAPFTNGVASGRLDGVKDEVQRSGMGDMVFRFTVSLLPDSALSIAEFRKRPPDRTLGASVTVIAPTGEYYDDKLINLSTNRWAIRPEIGGSRQFGRWEVDGSAGVWFFTDNNDFLETSERSQEPIGAVQGHLSYTFAPRLWLGGSVTWYTGGRTLINGESRQDTQNNTRAGLTLALPIGQQHSVKLGWSTGVSVRFGGAFDLYLLSWQYLWFR
jgi:hypothetical protein